MNIIKKIDKIKSSVPVVNTLLRGIAKKNVRKLRPIKLSDKEFLDIMGYKKLDEIGKKNLSPFFFDINDKNKIIEMIKEENPSKIKETIKDADEICNWTFNLLGSGKVKLNKLDWHCDFKSNYQWDSSEYYTPSWKYLDYMNNDIYADVKVPWELSRFQHLVTLGKAYWYTNNEKYVNEFVNQINNWIENNPIEFGVNWVCTMDVAIRAVNWIWGYYFFQNSSKLTPEFKTNLFKSLFLHGRHIINNLEWESRNNHYLSNIVGLVYLGILFNNTNEGKIWFKKGFSGLIEEMNFQIYPDGVNFESSISYQRLDLELFASSTLLCLINGYKFPESYLNRLKNMIEFVVHYSKPDGSSPQIGDADDGRLHILSDFSKWNKLDHRYLISIGAYLFDKSDFMNYYPCFNEESFWMLGGKLKYESRVSKNVNSRSFPDGGYYIMRNRDLYLIFDGSTPKDKSPKVHRHNSALNFELFANGKNFIVDPGSYIYTADKNMRNLFRSTHYHNVIRVDEKDQNNYNEDEIFEMGTDAKVKVNKWEVNDNYDFIDAEHYGYMRLVKQVLHRRQIYFDKNEKYWQIKDILEGEGYHNFELYFHLAQMEIQFYKNSQYIITSNSKDGKNIIIIPMDTENLSVELEDGWISESYGEKYKSPVLKYSKYTKVPTDFTTLIYSYINPSELNHFLKKLDLKLD